MPDDEGLREEAREQIARWLVREYGELLDHDPPGYWEFQARELLTDCPEVTEALAAVERVRALADAMEAEGRSLPPGGGAVADTTACERIMTAHRLRELLDGEPR